MVRHEHNQRRRERKAESGTAADAAGAHGPQAGADVRERAPDTRRGAAADEPLAGALRGMRYDGPAVGLAVRAALAGGLGMADLGNAERDQLVRAKAGSAVNKNPQLMLSMATGWCRAWLAS